MVAGISFLMFAFKVLFSFHNAFAKEMWRYRSQEGDGTLFFTQNSIVLEHLGVNKNVEWCYPNVCSLKNKSFTNAILRCRKPGFHPVASISNDSDVQNVRYIQVVHSPFYYEWYLAYDQELRNQSHEEFRLWIMDPKHLSESERNRTASFPSQFSKELTGVFVQMGQSPVLKVKVGHRLVSWDDWKIFNKSYITNGGYWHFSVTSVPNPQLTVWIDGQSVALHDQFIRKKSIHLLKIKFPYLFTNHPEQVALGGTYPKQSVIVQDPCASHVAVLISSICVFTQDNFASAQELKMPSNLLMQSEAFVKSVIFSASNLVVLLESGRVLVFNGTTQTWGNSSGLSQQGLSGLASQKKCLENSKNVIMTGVVLGWTNESADFAIYISKDSGLTFQYLPIPGLGVTIMSIAHAEIHCLFPVVTFLLNATTYSTQHKMLFVQYSLLGDTWEEKGFQQSGFIHGPPVSFTFAPPSSQFVVVWSQKTIAFGRLDETGIFFKVKSHGNLTNFTLDNSETIKSVIPGGNGEFAVYLSNNRIFYGRASIQHMVEVFAGEDPSSKLAVMFDVFGSLLVITNNNGTAHTRKLPLGNEILNALYPDTSCPFLKFTTSARPELHFIDKGNELKLFIRQIRLNTVERPDGQNCQTIIAWALLIYPRIKPNDIRLEISSSDVLRIETEDTIEHYSGIVTLNKIYTFICDLRNGTALPGSAYKSTVVSVTMFPNLRELTCENDLQVLHINVGCPPSKTIVIRNCTVPSGEGPVPYLSQVQGSSEQLACHLTAVVSESFKLVLDMYEKDRFVQEVHTDYVVLEETGKTDYRYTATMTEAGCLKEAQSWRRMITNTSGETTNPWTQNNYQSCFEPDPSDKSFDGSQPYEILNSSGISQLVFLGSGLFRFQLRVVGAHLSFCELTTRFSVEVTSTDEAKEFLPQLVSVLVVTLSSTILLYISFAYYTKKTLHRHQEDEEEQQRLQELKSLFSSYQQGADDEGVAPRRSTSHSVRRFAGTAMLMTNRLPEECLVKESPQAADIVVNSLHRQPPPPSDLD